MTTLGAMLRSTGQLHASRIAIRDDAGNLRWDAYEQRIAQTATELRSVGVYPGRRYGLLGRNSVTMAELVNAGYWSGAIPVPLNFRLAPREVAELLRDAQCDWVFVDCALGGLLQDAALADWRDRVVAFDPDASATGCAWRTRVRAAAPLPVHEQSEDNEALLLYTGGTTGRGKGVPLSHRNILANALQLSRVMSASAADTYLHAAPMFHSTDLKSTVVSLFGGSHVYLREFSPQGVVDAARRHGVTILSLVPTMIARLLDGIACREVALPAVRLVTYGSSPMDETLLQRCAQAFAGVGFHQCYGLTETSPFVAVLDEATHFQALEGRPELLKAAGRPLPATEIRLVDGDGREVPTGSEGEITVRGPQVARGYLERPDEEVAAWRGGWFHTGDIGRLDDEGLLYVLGRRKDMVITGGENVYTREVENVLLRHPRIVDAAVVGVPDPVFGEALLAALVCRPGDPPPTPQAVVAFCRSHLGGFKIPRLFRFIPELPRTAMGKLRKQDLVDAHLARPEDTRGVAR